MRMHANRAQFFTDALPSKRRRWRFPDCIALPMKPKIGVGFLMVAAEAAARNALMRMTSTIALRWVNVTQTLSPIARWVIVGNGTDLCRRQRGVSIPAVDNRLRCFVGTAGYR